MRAIEAVHDLARPAVKHEVNLRLGDPFVRHEWMRTWWDNFGGSARLHIIVVRDDSGIVAIAPLHSLRVRWAPTAF